MYSLDRIGRVVCRSDHDGPHRIFQAEFFTLLEIDPDSPLFLRGPLRCGPCRSGGDCPCRSVEDDIGDHELGHARGRPLRVHVLLFKHLARGGLHNHIGFARLGRNCLEPLPSVLWGPFCLDVAGEAPRPKPRKKTYELSKKMTRCVTGCFFIPSFFIPLLLFCP